MSKEPDWLAELSTLRIDHSKGAAPHKPLLLLLVLEMAEKGEIDGDVLQLTPELAFRFSTYWSIVAHRRSQRPDVRLPFHHLKSANVWKPFTSAQQPSPDRSVTKFVRINLAFVEFINDPHLRIQARRILIAKYFEPAERNALYSLAGMQIPKDDEIARDASYHAPRDAQAKGREARFRLDIVAAYHYTCALTGYRVTTINGSAIVDAAHIHQFSDSRNDNPRNGLALCKNAHWLFDNGLWSLDDNYRVIVAAEHFSEDNPDQKSLSEYVGLRVRLPEQETLWPDQKHLRWHRNNRFAKE
jgi:putative restriction endonuclease